MFTLYTVSVRLLLRFISVVLSLAVFTSHNDQWQSLSIDTCYSSHLTPV